MRFLITRTLFTLNIVNTFKQWINSITQKYSYGCRRPFFERELNFSLKIVSPIQIILPPCAGIFGPKFDVEIRTIFSHTVFNSSQNWKRF